jgi:amino acid permease
MSEQSENNKDVTSYLGFFRKRISLFEAIALISSATIGAGVLGIPYAIAKVGIPVGIFYIVAIGLLMIGLNQLVGSIILRSKGEYQLTGLAEKYLGKSGKFLMTLFTYSILLGALVVYIIGVGESLAAIFGGSNFIWSLSFWLVGAIVIWVGLRTLKKVEMIMSLAILAIVLVIAATSAPEMGVSNLSYTNFAELLFPYGVLLFAFHGTTSIPEAHQLLENKQHNFKRSIFWSGVVSMIIYILFATIVVGVTGPETTEVATVGLGQEIGSIMNLLGNIFAVLAMGTSFLIIGLSLRDSLQWDYDLKQNLASLITVGLPLVIFLLGLRGFTKAIDLVGGVFMSLEMSLLVFIYWKAKQEGNMCPVKYNLHHTLLFAAIALIAFAIGTIYSLTKVF